MSPERERLAVAQWVNQRAPGSSCPLCRTAMPWLPLDRAPGFPFAGIACKNCAHVELLDAAQIGLDIYGPR